MTPRRLCSVALVLPAPTMSRPAATQEPIKDGLGREQVPELGEYRIGPEDMLQISVWKNEAMSRTVALRPDGKIPLPLLSDLRMAAAPQTARRLPGRRTWALPVSVFDTSGLPRDGRRADLAEELPNVEEDRCSARLYRSSRPGGPR